MAATAAGSGEPTTTIIESRDSPTISEVNASQHPPTHTEILNAPDIFRSHLDGIDQTLNIILQTQPLPSTDNHSLAGHELSTASISQETLPCMETLNLAEPFHAKPPHFIAAKTDTDTDKTSVKAQVDGPSHGLPLLHHLSRPN